MGHACFYTVVHLTHPTVWVLSFTILEEPLVKHGLEPNLVEFTVVLDLIIKEVVPLETVDLVGSCSHHEFTVSGGWVERACIGLAVRGVGISVTDVSMIHFGTVFPGTA